MATIRIGYKTLGSDLAPYITFEIGGTMSGLMSAMRLAECAANAGADALKVQILDVDTLIGGAPVVHFTDADGVEREESQRAALQRRTLTRDEWKIVGARCEELGLDLIATVDNAETSLDTAIAAKVKAIKICSGDITNTELIRCIAVRTMKPILLDTGHATLGELERSVNAVIDAASEVMIHQVAGGYPAAMRRVNLSQIPVLMAAFPEAAIGYSSHIRSWHVDAAAVALGASMIEKNLTLDRHSAGPEQSTAVAPNEARDFVLAMHNVWTSIGKPERKRILPAERYSQAAARRCAFASSTLHAGDTIKCDDFDYRRPSVLGGFEPPDEVYLIGRRVAVDIPAGSTIMWSYLV
jgi:sialic acid synthase SpsE